MNAVIPSPHEQTLPQWENAGKCVLLFVLLAAGFVLADAVMHHSGWPLVVRWLVVIGIAHINGLWLIGFGVLAHEAVHRVLFRSSVLNEAIGGIAAAMMLTPFHANRQFHLTHHAYAHQPGLDPENRMHDRPFWQAMTLGSLMGLWLQYRILLANAAKPQPRYRKRLLLDVLSLAIAGGFYIGIPLLAGLDVFVTTGLTVLVFPLVFAWRAISDHYGLPAVARKSQQLRAVEDGQEWQTQVDAGKVTGWVVLTHPWLEWLWSHVNYHEVHHKYPWLAHCHLPAAFQATRDSVPYCIVPGYWRSLLARARQPYYPLP